MSNDPKYTVVDVSKLTKPINYWEPGDERCPVCGQSKFKDLDADIWADWQPAFCPNCGTRIGKS